MVIAKAFRGLENLVLKPKRSLREKLIEGIRTVVIILGGILLIFGAISIRNNLPPSSSTTPPIFATNPRAPHNIVESTKNLEILWSKSNVFTNYGIFGSSPDLVAAKGTVFLMGSISQTENYSLFAFDAKDGTTLWRIPGHRSSLYATSTALYVGSTYSITAHDLRTGEQEWIKRFLSGSARNIEIVKVEDDLIFARLGGFADEYVMAVDTRKRVAVDLFSPEYFDGSSVFNDQLMFVRPRPPETEIKALDRQTSTVQWRADVAAQVISNLAATQTTVYCLTEDGRLVGLAAETGKVVASVQFEPSPFITFDPKAPPGGYYVAVDKDEGLLYALLGDSAQLFAFSIVADAGISPD